MSVIDQPPGEWVDKVTGFRVKPEHYHRFVKCTEVIEPNKDPDLREG